MRQKTRDRRVAPRAEVRSMLGYSRRLDSSRQVVLGVGSALDVSRSGLRFVAYEAIPESSRLELKLVLDGRQVTIPEGRVVRAEAIGNGAFEIAVAFSELDPGARIAIESYVRSTLHAQLQEDDVEEFQPRGFNARGFNPRLLRRAA